MKKSESWNDILCFRDFNLYIVAYVLFYIAAGLVFFVIDALPPDPEFQAASNAATVIRFAGLGLFAVLGGLLADRIGRKKPIILGLMMLGAAYALIGLLTTPDTYFIHLLLSGFAWGILMMMYLVIPGDLSFPGSTEKFYALGWLLPLILYTGINGLGRFIEFVPPINLFSTILSIILFLSLRAQRLSGKKAVFFSPQINADHSVAFVAGIHSPVRKRGGGPASA